MSLTGTRIKPLKRYEVTVHRKVKEVLTHESYSKQDVKRALQDGGLIRRGERTTVKEIK